MNKVILSGMAVALLAITALSQDRAMKGSEYCSSKRLKHVDALMKTSASANSPRHSFDVLSYTLSLDIYSSFIPPYPKSFKAMNTVKFRVDSALSSIQLNAVNSSLVVDSVTLAGKTFSQTNDILTIGLDSARKPNDIVTVKIYYRHNNVADGAFYASNGMVFTDCEPEGARKWFPCWDSPADKATLDLTAKVPSSAKLGSNGKLADTLRSADTLSYHWVSKDPIATYLMVMSAKVGYNLDIVYWQKLSNPNDSIPIVFYWNTGESIAGLNNIKVKILPMTSRYSVLFGEHPFEKNGFATLNNQFQWGGMENQTLTSLCPNCWSENLVSHEFAHQWFGDMISPGTWADVWLNEGFATYCESLWYEYTGGSASYKADVLSDASGYLSSNPGWAIYNPQWAVTTPSINTLFNTEITYYKGACVLHQLRGILGDSLFFACLKGYATDTTNFRLKNSVTNDFIQKVNTIAGQDLNWFFDEWVKQPNHPVYQNIFTIDTVAKQVSFKIKQTQTNTVFFTMPVELKITFSDATDTTVKVTNNANNQIFNFTFAKKPTGAAFDPNDKIVLKDASTVQATGVTSEELATLRYDLEQNYPNPFNSRTHFRFSVTGTQFISLKIYDILGKEVATLLNAPMNPGKYTMEWDAVNAPSGVYFYRLQAGTFVETKKLVLVK